MYFQLPSLAVIGLAVLSNPAAGLGISSRPLAHDLRLASEFGLEPNVVWKHQKTFSTLFANLGDADVPTEHAEIPIDHNDLSVGTYENRYWVNDDYYTPGGPVFIYDVGETNAQGAAKARLVNETSFFQQYLKEFNGIGIVWEHRYYGESLPFPVDKDTPPEHLKYLTTKQALADIPYFAKTFSRKSHKDIDLTPDSTPWVMIGGSYAGVRTVFTRNEYPDTIYAAFASSPPVQARVNMSIYFEQVWRGMNAYGYGDCVRRVQSAFKYIDDKLSHDDTAAAIKKKFLGSGAEDNSNEAFTAVLGAVFDYFQSYGTDGGEGSLGDFCDWLDEDADSTTKPPFGMKNSSKLPSSKDIVERWAAWPTFAELVNFNTGENCKGLNDTLPQTCTLGKRSTDPNTISWSWQYCTEWGYYQSNNFGPHALLSSYQTLKYQQDICNRQFPDAVKKGLLPSQPQANELDAQTGGWYVRPSNLYTSGGQYDPWRTLSTLSTEDDGPQGVTFTTDIPACGVKTEQDTVFGYILEKAEHCHDFQLNSVPGAISRGIFSKALKEWLPCFKPKKATPDSKSSKDDDKK